MKIDKLLGYIISVPLFAIFLIGTPLVYLIGLGITRSFNETNELIKYLLIVFWY